ncbi:uncharacterized protein AC631_00344 [Debaryomyces fabryi]|uniref:DNA 3'-phosphatase n=1 Tax=Debaryomyces fabryi TaxID=58627 RepID=A0A0V1Q5U7_9ASCO|nr:uncharacterized protein AC631_00344 [Debaryomyces fabryi]KSA03889.1 hypothetical protein AC631_00344 [Debaryomyces fabryi]CUM48755.1 unnamed protein product [Debaryomyces fabryi]
MANDDIFSMLKTGQNAASKISKARISRPKEADISGNLQQVNQSILSKDFNHRWRIHGTHLITNLPKQLDLENYYISKENEKIIKIAAFDLDGTLVDTKTGQKFARGADDWRWWTSKERNKLNVTDELKKLAINKYIIVVFTNQGGVVATKTSKSYLAFTGRVNNVVKELTTEEKVPGIFVYASPKKPASKNQKISVSSDEDHAIMRKPNIGMWNELVKYFEKQGYKIDTRNSFFVGDAAGRPKDFLDSDKMFAEKINIQFKIPEEFFG